MYCKKQNLQGEEKVLGLLFYFINISKYTYIRKKIMQHNKKDTHESIYNLFFNMASFDLHNPLKPSLKIIYWGTLVFLEYFGPFSNQRRFQSFHTRVCNRTGLAP